MSTVQPDSFRDYCYEILPETDAPINQKHQHWFLIPAVLIIVAYCFLEKRKNFKKNILGGRPAPVKPFSFLDEFSNRWGIMLVFGSVTGNIIQIIERTFSAKFPVWAKIFLIYILSLEQTLICYPLFASMTTRHKLVGAIVGLLYSIGWFVFEMFFVIQFGRCYAKYQVEHTNVAAYMLIRNFPVMLCNFLLIIKFCHKLYRCIKRKRYKDSADANRKLCSSHNMTYVRNLLEGHRCMEEETKRLTIKERLQRKVFRTVPGFRLPISILITAFMSAILLYMVGLLYAAEMELLYKGIPFLQDYVDLLTATNVIASIAAFVNGTRNIVVFVNNYTRDVLKLYRGDRSFIPKTLMSKSPNVYMARGMRFVGNAIVGMFWGTVIVYFMIFIPFGATMLVFRYLIRADRLDDLFEQLEWILYPVFMIIIFQLQVRLIGCFLIQPKLQESDRQKPLAVDNRNAYDILAFFMMFLNASIGVFLFLRRILTGAFLGIFLAPRMDICLLLSGYENMDKCYVNYIGMLMVDVAHNNPTMRVFCHIVKQSVRLRNDPYRSTVENPVYVSNGGLTRTEGVNKISKRRWFLIYTLVKNPKLVEHRKRNFMTNGVSINDVIINDSKTKFSKQEVDQDQTGSLVLCCGQNRKLTIPPNISTNLAAAALVLIIAFLYMGVSVLARSLVQ